MNNYYTIQGTVKKEICRNKDGIVTYERFVINDTEVFMLEDALYSREDIRVGDEVVVICFDEEEADGSSHTIGISLTWLKKAAPLTPQEFAEKMKSLAMNNDTEVKHGDMDDLMCETLKALGYEEGIKIFENTDKWYS